MKNFFKHFSTYKNFYIYTPILVYYTLMNKNKFNLANTGYFRNNILYLNTNTKFREEKSNQYDDKNNTINIDNHLHIHHSSTLKELDFHVTNFEHIFHHLKLKEIFFNPELSSEQDSSTQLSKISSAIQNYKKNKEVNKLFTEIRKINKHLKNYLNKLEYELNNNNFKTEMNFNHILDNLQRVEEKRKTFKISDDKDTNRIFVEFLFSEHEEIMMRLFSCMVVYYKHDTNLISKNNLKFIIDYCKKILNDEENKINESKLYYAKRVLINLFSKKEYFYGDYILEINQGVNYLDLLNNFYKGENNLKNKINKIDEKFSEIIEDSHFDYDIVFISGLNATFSKSWRIPKSEHWRRVNIQHHLDFYLHGKHLDKFFHVPSYELWIPKMFENETFKNYKIRYMVTCAETKIFPRELEIYNIPDFSVQEIADKIYNSFLHAGIGKRPLIIVCHSMGGLICKKVLHKLDEKMLNNVKGVVFFSTPHFGSDAIKSLLELGFQKFTGLFKLFETTSTEYGLLDEDVAYSLVDLRFTKATEDICLAPKSQFVNEHENFKKLGVKYICMNETEQSFIKALQTTVHLVDPESSFLPETQNFLLQNKNHSNLQKFSPDNYDEEGYLHLTNFIRRNFKI